MEERTSRPPHIRPPMARENRAKQFAPFAALGRLDDTLKAVEEGRDIGELEHIRVDDDMDYMTSEDQDWDITSI